MAWHQQGKLSMANTTPSFDNTTAQARKTAFLTSMISVGAICLSTTAQAGLSINGVDQSSHQASPQTSQGRIAWGGSDNLERARSIMYNNSDGGTGYGGKNTHANNITAYSYPSEPRNFANYNAFEELAISTGSRGVMVYDLSTGRSIYEKNAHQSRPIASISKIMTAMVLLDAEQNMGEEIVLEPIDFVGPKKSSSRLQSGDRMNRAELILMMLMKSENPAAKTLARHYPGGYGAFIQAMNQKAQSLGMTSTYFGDPTGLDKRNVASPSDLVKLVQAAGQYDVIRSFSTTPKYDFYVSNYSSGNRRYYATNTNYLVKDKLYPIGISKTGFISEAGRCVVMETRINNRPAVVVLLGADSSAIRWRDAENIIQSLSMRRYT